MTHGGLYGKIFIAQWKQKMNRLYKSGKMCIRDSLGYDQDHEGEHCQADVSCPSGTEEGTLGRASVESILLCNNGERQEQGTGMLLHRRAKRKTET